MTTPFDLDGFHEECGVFGVYGTSDAAAIAALGLHALQHRGQEAAGIVSYDYGKFHSHRSLGLVGEIFDRPDVIGRLKGTAAVGHNRYSTAGETILRNVQPLFAEMGFGGLAVAHNGNLTNAMRLRDQLVRRGSLFQSTSDTEVIIHLMATSPLGPVVDRLVDSLRQVDGAYSLVFLTAEGLIGVRDPLGVRPLLLGRLGDAHILCSETCALDIIGATFIREIEPGEVITIGAHGIKSIRAFANDKPRFCIFEYVYFSRPDSRFQDFSVYTVRKNIGRELAAESPVDGDLVVPVPDSGVPAALGYSQAANIPFELGIIRNHYVGRTFIQPTDNIRHLGVKLKHNPNPAELAGKRVILVDDSIVRGTTSVKIVQMVRDAGAREVHMRIASPPTTNPCFYGVDTPSKEKLLAAQMTLEEMRRYIGVDSLAFVSIDGLYRAVGEAKRNNEFPQFCDACFSGEYPIRLTDQEATEPRQRSLLAGLD